MCHDNIDNFNKNVYIPHQNHPSIGVTQMLITYFGKFLTLPQQKPKLVFAFRGSCQEMPPGAIPIGFQNIADEEHKELFSRGVIRRLFKDAGVQEMDKIDILICVLRGYAEQYKGLWENQRSGKYLDELIPNKVWVGNHHKISLYRK